jgi:hypothetical protein
VATGSGTQLSSPALIRELARNLERTIAGAAEAVCLGSREGQPFCECYRDAGHNGEHRCMCGAEWPSR